MEDIGIIIAIVGTGVTFVASMVAMFLWNRAEARSDYKHLENRTNVILESIRQDMKDFNDRWIQETKDFHGRLCAIEERNKK